QLSRPPSQPWRTFLANHLSAIVSMDFFTVSTLTGRVLFVLVLMAHDRRRIVHVNVTEHPTSAWTAQQLVEAFPEDSAPRWLLRDRDSIYDDHVRRRIASLGITEVVSSPLSPWQNPGAHDRLHSPRVSRPRHRPQRPASPPRASRVSRLLPSEPHASRLEQRRPGRQAG